MASFSSACLTKKGMALLAKAQVEQAVIAFTKAATGNGTYTEEDILVDMETLKDQQQEFPISTVSIVDNSTVYLKFIVSNCHGDVALLEGYHVTEVGIFAEDPDEGEILYAIATAVQDQSDYLPEYNNLLPSTITMEFYATVANAAEVSIKAKSGAYVYQEDFEDYKREIHAELQSVKNPVFEDYTESEIPEPETALGEIVSGKPIDIIHQYTKASLMGILTVAKKALNIALGRNQARVFASVADLDAWLSVPENVSKLNVGDNFYIIATDVPDYWWDGNTKQKLETQKVDLTTYDQRIAANASAINELNGNFSVKSAMRVSWTTGRGSALGLPDETGYYVLNRMAVYNTDGSIREGVEFAYGYYGDVNIYMQTWANSKVRDAWMALYQPNLSTNSITTGYSGEKEDLSSHTHDSRYYTETEVNALLAGKSGTSHSHAWSTITEKPTTFPPSSHTHRLADIVQSPTLGYSAKENVSLPQSEYTAIVRLEIKPNTQYLMFGHVNFGPDIKDGSCYIDIRTNVRTVPMSSLKREASNVGTELMSVCAYYIGDSDASYVDLVAYRSGAAGKNIKVTGQLRTIQVNGYG